MSVTLNNLGGVSGTITMSGSQVLLANSRIIQHVYTRSDLRTTYSANPSGDGTTITALNTSFTPKDGKSIIWLRFVLFGDVHHDTMLLAHRDGNLIGFNQYRGNVRYSGIYTPQYDNDYGSTPNSMTFNWFDQAGGTAARTYAPAIRSSSSGTYTLALNRTVSSTGQDSYEVGISYAQIREIAQA